MSRRSRVTGNRVGRRPCQNLTGKDDSKPRARTARFQIKTDVPSFAALAKMLPHVDAREGRRRDHRRRAYHRRRRSTLVARRREGRRIALVDQRLTERQAGKPIKLDKTTLDANADIKPSLNGQSLDSAALMKAVRSIVDQRSPRRSPSIKGGGVPEKLQIDGNVDLTKSLRRCNTIYRPGENGAKRCRPQGQGRRSRLATAGLPKDGGDAVRREARLPRERVSPLPATDQAYAQQ